MHRPLGIEMLRSVMKREENIEVIEKYVVNHTRGEEEYLDVIYDLTCTLTSKENIQNAIQNIHDGNFGWNDKTYNACRAKIEEEDQFATNPFEIEEGVLECKCGSKRTISFQRQTRSADEGSTTFAHCVECGTRWRHNN